MVKIEFFLKGKSVGKADDLAEMSKQIQRDNVAKNLEIEEYDEFILDDGRVRCRKVPGTWVDESGQVWETL